MTTVIRASGVNFNNPNLPVIEQIVTDGLVAAYRPSTSAMSLVDLSGNGHNLQQVGNPTLTSKGVVGDVSNGFATDITETRSLTYIAVHKVVKTGSDNRSFAVGCYSQSNSVGSSIWTDNDAGSSTLKSQVYLYDASVSKNKNQVILFHSGAVYDYVFSALVVDADAEKVLTYIPSQSSAPKSTFNVQAESKSLKSRTLSTVPVKIAVNTDNDHWLGQSHVAEVLIYDKALTTTQILQQYEYSKAFMLKNRGIAI